MLVKSLSPYSHAFSSFSASFGTNPSWVPLKSSNSLCCSSKPRNLSRFLCLSTQNGGGFRENSGEVGRGDAAIIVDHGSRRKESNLMLSKLNPSELAEPSIRDAFQSCVEQGAHRIIVSPFFLFPGRHWSQEFGSFGETTLNTNCTMQNSYLVPLA
ncbi:hypothetical protein JHK84_051947 [Glycine max]|nr:hypothetical protein JHK84_051947 [Glycine max]